MNVGARSLDSIAVSLFSNPNHSETSKLVYRSLPQPIVAWFMVPGARFVERCLKGRVSFGGASSWPQPIVARFIERCLIGRVGGLPQPGGVRCQVPGLT